MVKHQKYVFAPLLGLIPSVNLKSGQSLKYFVSAMIYKSGKELGTGNSFWVRTTLLRSKLLILTNHSVVQTGPKLFLGNDAKVSPRRMQKPHPQKAGSLAACPFLLGELRWSQTTFLMQLKDSSSRTLHDAECVITTKTKPCVFRKEIWDLIVQK